jgi:hypothetical protein
MKRPLNGHTRIDCDATIELVTPELARHWLLKNNNNRNVSKPTVAKYARDIKSGDWGFTADPIRFSRDGDLLDGQHRLMACVLADVNFSTLVVRNLDPQTRRYMDMGKGRTIADTLQWNGIKNATSVAALARVLLCDLRYGGFMNNRGKATFSASEVEAIVTSVPQIAASVNKVKSCRVRGGLIGSATYLAYVHVVGTLVGHPGRSDDFLSVFTTGAPDYPGCAAHALREKIIRDRVSNTITTPYYFPAYSAAWNHFVTKKQVTILRWSDDSQISKYNPKIHLQPS